MCKYVQICYDRLFAIYCCSSQDDFPVQGRCTWINLAEKPEEEEDPEEEKEEEPDEPEPEEGPPLLTPLSEDAGPAWFFFQSMWAA